MASIADSVAAAFKQLPSLQAYRFEVLGTILGMILFAALSYLQTSPLIWGLVTTALFSSLLLPNWRQRLSVMTIMQIASLLCMLGVFYVESTTANHMWSTYYKIQVAPFANNRYVINVNGMAQQVIDSVAQRKELKSFYFKSYQHINTGNKLDNVLVIGAGTGGDVAIALAQGAKHVDAVEIDPAIYAIGKKLHPNQPYQDPRVTVHINDDRALLQRTQQQYDLIIYALTDSLMLIPSQSSLRLENYMYTLEGLTAASKRLKPDGVFAFYNYFYTQNWFIDRIANTLSLIYSKPPCLDEFGIYIYGTAALTTSFNSQVISCPKHWISSGGVHETPSTDNHPFIYLKDSSLSPLYVISLIYVSLLALFLVKKTGTSVSAMRNYFDLFLMGVAFLLLETKSVVSYALLFGSTWMINTLVFTGILFSVYLAIEVARRYQDFNRYVLYALLCIALVVAWFIPASSLLSLSPVLRFMAATTLTFSPIFIANLIFAGRIAETATSTDAMGANLLGAVFGGLLEYSSLILGHQHLILLILVMYSAAFVWLLQKRVALRESYA